jgi:16S rRNA (cytosine967-C5)-methyltransferase
MKDPRTIAYDLLSQVMLNHAYANLALKNGLYGLEEQDKALITALVYTTLRYQPVTRAVWLPLVPKAPKPKVAVLLDMAVTQLVHLDKLPAYAVVDESVKLAKRRFPEAAGMINAVLRQIALDPLREPVGADALETQALRYALPRWIYALWVKQLGEQDANALAEALLEEAPLCARINPLKIDPQVIGQDPRVRPGALAPYAVYGELPWLTSDWFKNGQLIIQDEASQLVAHFTGVQANQRVLDLCSAPGSKSTAMAAMMNNTGSILACDVSSSRLKLVDQQAQKLGVTNLITLVLDGTTVHEQGFEPFDVVLVDAPCSGLGVIRHKPDIKVHLTPTVLDELVVLQRQLLDAASQVVKPGGVLVYSTCTINTKENQGQIKTFLNHHPDFVAEDERQILPQTFGTDGFYMAKLRRLVAFVVK